MNQAELLGEIEQLTYVKEEERRAGGGSINPELIAMLEVLQPLNKRLASSVRKRMAFDIVHFQERRIQKEDALVWIKICREAWEYLPKVPRNIDRVPRGWDKVFSDVVHLYGNPDG